MSNTYTKTYLASGKVHVYPCASRGANIDLESKLNTEYNLTNLGSMLGGDKNYIIPTGESTLKFWIHGYYFEANLSNSNISISGNLWAAIKLKSVELATSINTLILSNFEYAEADIDDESCFRGLAFSTSEIASNEQQHIYALKIIDNGSLCNTYIASNTRAGLVKSSTTGTIDSSDRDYSVEVKSDGTMKVNVPWVESIAYCDTAAWTSAKTASLKGFYQLKHGKTIWLWVANTSQINDATTTLNINNTGARPIYINGFLISDNNRLLSGSYLATYTGIGRWYLVRINEDHFAKCDWISDGSKTKIATGYSKDPAIGVPVENPTYDLYVPYATTSRAGVVQLTSDTNSTSEMHAATAKAVKTVRNAIGNGTLTIKAEGSTKGIFTANTTANTEINITAADLGLSGAIKFIGKTTTAIEDGATTNPITIGGNSVTAVNGDIVLYNGIEYIWDASQTQPCWVEMGSGSSYASSSRTVTGTGALGGGGDLTADRTITHKKPSTSPKQSTSAVYKITVDEYGHVLSTSAASYSDVGAAASSHTHGNITNAGKLTTASRIVVTDSSKNITTGSIDPDNLVVTTDSRLSDARTPTSHASTLTTYGAGTTTEFGHVKLIDGDLASIQSTTNGNAAASNHTHSQYAPVDHSSNANTYGLGTTSNYGHVKFQNGDLNGVSSSDGIAAGLGHTHSQYLTDVIALCKTIGSTRAKTASAKNFVATIGKTIIIRFEYTHTSNESPTLNVGSTGAYPIKINGEDWDLTSNNLWSGDYKAEFALSSGINGTNYWKLTDLADTLAHKFFKQIVDFGNQVTFNDHVSFGGGSSSFNKKVTFEEFTNVDVGDGNLIVRKIQVAVPNESGGGNTWVNGTIGQILKVVDNNGTINWANDDNTDEKVKQNSSDTDATFPLLLKYNASSSSTTNSVKFSTKILGNPSTGVVTATSYSAKNNNYILNLSSDTIKTTLADLTYPNSSTHLHIKAIQNGRPDSYLYLSAGDTEANLTDGNASVRIWKRDVLPAANDATTTTVYVQGGLGAKGLAISSNSYLNHVTATTYTATSDLRKKENIIDFTPEKSILDLPIKKFDFIDGLKNQIGCIAQDLQQICPELVQEDSEGYLTIQESKLVYLLLDEVKKLRKEIDELKGE